MPQEPSSASVSAAPPDIASDMTIADAHALLSAKYPPEQSGEASAPEGAANIAPKTTASVYLTLRRDGQTCVVQQADLAKMMVMDLGALPVEAIAIPQDSPLFQNRYQELTATEDLSRQLTRFFPTYFVAGLYEIQSLLAKADIRGYVVGGIPRDLLLYQQKRFDLQDVDITVEGDAIELGRFLAQHSRNFCLAEEFPEFGTVKIHYKDTMILDIASTRQEVYAHAGALPDVVRRGVPLVEDIIRRDFTINALAFSIHDLGRILDYTHGIKDIQSRCIRILHPVSFYEDPSRMLRALKFAVRFNFSLADETQALMEEFLTYGALVYKGGGERIKYELKSFLKATYQESFTPAAQETLPDPETVKRNWLEFFLRKNCLQLANMELIRRIPEAKIAQLLAISRRLPMVLKELEQYLYYDFIFDVYLCFLFGDLSEEEQENSYNRLGLTRSQREAIEKYVRLQSKKSFYALKEFSSATEIYQIFHNLPIAAVAAGILETGLTEDCNRFKILLDAYRTYKRKWEHIKLELDGHNLIELGVPQGKAIGDTLKVLLNAKLSGRVPDRMAEVRFVQDLVQELKQPLAQNPPQSASQMTSETLSETSVASETSDY